MVSVRRVLPLHDEIGVQLFREERGLGVGGVRQQISFVDELRAALR
jgi:hypothetical protein